MKRNTISDILLIFLLTMGKAPEGFRESIRRYGQMDSDDMVGKQRKANYRIKRICVYLFETGTVLLIETYAIYVYTGKLRNVLENRENARIRAAKRADTPMIPCGCGRHWLKDRQAFKPSAFESEIYPSHKSPIYVLCIFRPAGG